MDNRGLMILVVVLLVAVIGFFVLERAPQPTGGEKISNSISEVTEEIKDEIDDNTDAR